MRRIYFGLFFSCLAIAAVAQGANDPEAKKVLDAVSAKFKGFKTVQANFTYRVEDAKGKVMSTKTGTIWMKGTRYKVNFGGQEIFSDGKTSWS
jgi:outer membrane lipoprotein-sorting protein